VRSKTTKRFRTLFAALPADAKRQVRAAYQLFKDNPRHNSLHFKRISPSDPAIYSARIGDHYRAIGLFEGDTVTWTWVGSHEEYNNITKRL
jgi:mRNA-degrading endonuclease RelE of RelBE toxin-antitoxin system